MWFDILEALIVAAVCLLSSVKCMQVFQSRRYQMKSYTKWLSENRNRNLRSYGVITLVTIAVAWYLPILLALLISVEKARNSMAGWLVLAGFCAVTGIRLYGELTELRDTFVLTSRAKRLVSAHAVTYVILAVLLLLLRLPVYLMYAAVPYISWIPDRIMKPIEDSINKRFYDEARQKLSRRKDLICVGITGSQGKTATKFILKELLSRKYDVLTTPGSHNTQMGVSKTINDLLENHHQVFLAEMGAQYKGDIRALTNLVRPKYGVITSIAPQHVDTLGSMEKVMRAKEELIRGLPEKGMAFFGSDSMFVDRLYERCTREKYRATLDSNKKAYMYAGNISYTRRGMTFTLSCIDGGRIACRTKLLGRFHVQDIATAACVARKMGLTMAEIGEGIVRLMPREHCLELKESQKCTLIDDTACRTLDGAADALNVLMSMSGKRILVTGGLDQPDSRTEDGDYEYGSMMRDCVDLLVLVGDREDLNTIARAATEKRDGERGLSRKSVVYVTDREAARDYLNEMVTLDDIVLIEGYLE